MYSLDQTALVLGSVRAAARRLAEQAVACWSRPFWAALLVVHAPALLRAWRGVVGSHPSEGQIIAAAWLSTAVAFFVLKLAGVSWLRFGTDRRSRIALVMAILLIHCAPLGVCLDGVLAPSDVPLVSTLLLAAGLDGAQRFWRGIIRVGQGRPAELPHVCRIAIPPAIFTPRLAPLIVCAPRPPPFRR
jgi:hypothetical protein